MKADFLVEIGTEELPAKPLLGFIEFFKKAMENGLNEASLTYGKIEEFATPRRLALLVHDLDTQTPAREIEKRGPALQAAFDANGQPTQAILSFVRANGVSVDQLERKDTGKGVWLVARIKETPKKAADLLPAIVEKALSQIPVAKKMRWGQSEFEFIRPVKWVVLLLGEDVVPARLFGLEADRKTYGHRFLHPEAVILKHAADYEEVLEGAKVVASFEKRRDKIKEEILQKKVFTLDKDKNGNVIVLDGKNEGVLLQEVTGLVEWPTVVVCSFEPRFLQVPKEALSASMWEHQKCFPVSLIVRGRPQALKKDIHFKETPYENEEYELIGDLVYDLDSCFIAVSNLGDHPNIKSGNERVMRARLSDAEFFYHEDLKKTLEQHRKGLKTVSFQTGLGTLWDKSERIARFARTILHKMRHSQEGTSDPAAERIYEIGQLCKSDLMTQMVGEFPELQGIMGTHYYNQDNSISDKAKPASGEFIEQHYWPRFANDLLPTSPSAQALALADRLDTIIGIISTGQIPTGDKDPFGLRRASLGILRILIEKDLPLNLYQLLELAAGFYKDQNISLKNSNTVDDSFNYILERLRAYYSENFRPDQITVILAKNLKEPLHIDCWLNALDEFEKTNPEAFNALKTGSKRARNILKKENINLSGLPQATLFSMREEKDLWTVLEKTKASIAEKNSKTISNDTNYRKNYTENCKKILNELSQLRDPIDCFFDTVRVMDEDEKVRNNRLRLLKALDELFLESVDLSLLQ